MAKGVWFSGLKARGPDWRISCIGIETVTQVEGMQLILNVQSSEVNSVSITFVSAFAYAFVN
jgi:hypothetical protein